MEDVAALEEKIEELEGHIEILTNKTNSDEEELIRLRKERNDLFVERDELTKTNQDLSNALETARNEAQETAYRLNVVTNGIASLAQHTAFVGGQNNV